MWGTFGLPCPAGASRLHLFIHKIIDMKHTEHKKQHDETLQNYKILTFLDI